MNFYYFTLTIALLQGIKARSTEELDYINGLILRDQPVVQPQIQTLTTFDSCLDLTTSVEDMLHLSWKVFSWAYEKSEVVSTSLAKITNCTGIFTIPCIQKELTKIKKDLRELVPTARIYMHDASKLVLQIKEEVFSCI